MFIKEMIHFFHCQFMLVGFSFWCCVHQPFPLLTLIRYLNQSITSSFLFAYNFQFVILCNELDELQYFHCQFLYDFLKKDSPGLGNQVPVFWISSLLYIRFQADHYDALSIQSSLSQKTQLSMTE